MPRNPDPGNQDGETSEAGEVTFAEHVSDGEGVVLAQPVQVVAEFDDQVVVEETVDDPLLAEPEANSEEFETELPLSERPDDEHLATLAFAQAPTVRSTLTSKQELTEKLSQNGRVAINSGPVQTVRLPVQDDTKTMTDFPVGTVLKPTVPITVTPTQATPELAIQAAVTGIIQSVGKPREEVLTDPVSVLRSARSEATPSAPKLPNAPIPPIFNAPTPLVAIEKQTLAADPFGSSLLEPEAAVAQQSSAQTQQTIVAPTPLRVNAQPVAAQIAVALFQSNGATTEISLSPQELGKVRISMTSSEVGMVVNILAERPETTDLMRRHIDTLAREFQDLGYQQLSFSFSEGDGQSEHESTDRNTASNVMIAPEADQPVQGAVALGTLDLKL